MNLTKKSIDLRNLLTKNKVIYFLICFTLSGILAVLYAFKLFSKNLEDAAYKNTTGTYTIKVWTFYPWMMIGIVILGIGVILLLLATDENSSNRTQTEQVGERVLDGRSDIRLPDIRVRKNSNRVRPKNSR